MALGQIRPSIQGSQAPWTRTTETQKHSDNTSRHVRLYVVELAQQKQKIYWLFLKKLKKNSREQEILKSDCVGYPWDLPGAGFATRTFGTQHTIIAKIYHSER